MFAVMVPSRPHPDEVSRATKELSWMDESALRYCIEEASKNIHRKFEFINVVGDTMANAGWPANPYGVMRDIMILAREKAHGGA